MSIAQDLLTEDPAPAVQVRLYREVLGLEEESSAFIKANRTLAASRGVQHLAGEQWPDGSWGRLHSQDRTAKQRTITTEVGVARALALGLTSAHPILKKAGDHLCSILNGAAIPRDRAERNKRWPVGVRLFTAATLAQIRPDARELDEPFDLWVELARRTFADGAYDPEAEVSAHLLLTGAPVRDSYLTLNNRYALTLLSARPQDLPADLAAQLVHWMWRLRQGMKYVPAALHKEPTLDRVGTLESWFAAQELMSRFPAWRNTFEGMGEWLWDQRDAKGCWDFGKRAATSVVLPLAAHWRRPAARRQDWTARVLLLLQRVAPTVPHGP